MLDLNNVLQSSRMMYYIISTFQENQTCTNQRKSVFYIVSHSTLLVHFSARNRFYHGLELFDKMMNLKYEKQNKQTKHDMHYIH